MPIGSVSFNYTLNNFEVKKTFDTRINVKDELEFLRFSTSFESQAVGLSYISSPGINADRNILLVDTSNSITKNAKQNIEELEYLSDDFIIDYAGFYISDVVKEIDGEIVPLYFWHDLTSATNINNLEILNADKTPIDQKFWSYYDETVKVGYPRRGIYCNLQCSITTSENKYEIFYVRYKDLNNNLVIEELLDTMPFYSQASFSSTRDQREYIITQIGKEYSLQIVFDSLNYSPTPALTSQRFWLKRKNQSKIFMEKPGVVSPNERWSLKISPGDYFHDSFKYWVPEYYTQLFSPTFPYRLVKEKEAILVDTNLIYVDTNPIADLNIDGYYIYIAVKTSNGTVKRVLTNDPNADTYITKQGFVTDLFYEKDIIESVSANSGFILLNEKLDMNDKIYVTCRYIERYYLYDYLSVNPSINPEVLGKKLVFYIVPDASDRSVHHLVVDDKGVILDATETPEYISVESQATSGSTNALVDTTLSGTDYFTNYEIEILSGLNSGRKTKITGFTPITRTIQFAQAMPFPIQAKTQYRILKKLENYTSGSHSYLGWEGQATIRSYFKISEIYVVQSLSIPEISFLDTRILGGGISENNIESALQLQNESAWYWDLGKWDGTAYPGMGAIVVNLPRYILKELGGEFDRDQVDEIVKRHAASGSYMIVKYYDESTEIKRIIPSNGKAFIEWYLVDANMYKIYVGNSPDNLSLYTTEPGTRTSLTIQGLDNEKIYYVQVEPIVGGIARLRSKILGFMPFNFSSTLPTMKYGEGKYIQGSYE